MLDIGFIGLAQFLPALLLVLVSGYIADRFDRRRISAIGLFGRGAATLALVAFSISGSAAVWKLFAIAAVLGTADAILVPARRSIAPFITPVAAFPKVMPLWMGTFTAATIVGPIMGGFLYSLSASWAYGIAAALQFAAILPLLRAALQPRAGAQP